MEDTKQVNPEKGMGATLCFHSDRIACTVTKISKPNLIEIQEDTATRTDDNGMSESQTYEYTLNPNGRTWILRLRKNGKWIVKGESLKTGTVAILGVKDKYYDYSF